MSKKNQNKTGEKSPKEESKISPEVEKATAVAIAEKGEHESPTAIVKDGTTQLKVETKQSNTSSNHTDSDNSSVPIPTDPVTVDTVSTNATTSTISATPSTPSTPIVTSTPTTEKNEPKKKNTFGAPKKKSKLLKLGKWVVILGLIGFSGYQYMWIPLQTKSQELLSSAYLSDAVAIQEITVSVSSTGTVTPIDTATVTASMTGDIISAPFVEDGLVTKGQVLYTFDHSSMENSIAQAQLNLEKSQLSYDQIMDSLTLTSNYSGVVQNVYVETGDTVNVGTPLMDLSFYDTQTIEIPFHSIQTDGIFIGQSAVLTMDYTMEQLHGTVVSISPFEEVGNGGTVLRMVELSIPYLGGVNTNSTATATLYSENDPIYSASSGSFKANDVYTVTATTSGELTSFTPYLGGFVSVNDVIATVGGSSIDNSLETARLNIASSELSLESAQDGMGNYTITAPISGTVITKNFGAGDLLDSQSLSAAGGYLALIYDMSSLTFQMNIHELDINKIQVGQEVRITADAVEGATYVGYVNKISVNGTTAGGMTSYPITVVIENPEGLKPGMNVSAEVIVETVGSVLAVPVDAVKRGQDGAYVQVAPATALNENGMVSNPNLLETVYVELGSNDTAYIQVVSGLNQGDVVVWANEIVNPFASMMGPPT